MVVLTVLFVLLLLAFYEACVEGDEIGMFISVGFIISVFGFLAERYLISNVIARAFLVALLIVFGLIVALHLRLIGEDITK